MSQALGLVNDSSDINTRKLSKSPEPAKRDLKQSRNSKQRDIGTVTSATGLKSQLDEKEDFRDEAASPKEDENSSWKKIFEEGTALATETAVKEDFRPQLRKKKEKKNGEVYINVKDPLDRTFKFPYRLCLTWEVSSSYHDPSISELNELQNMQGLVREVFDDESSEAAKIRNPAQSGQYDLCDETGVIYPPKLWESMIGAYGQSGLTVKFKPWTLLESKVQAVEVIPAMGLPRPEKGGSVQTEMSRMIAEEAEQSIDAQIEAKSDPESSTESSNDPADSFIDDNLHWRYNFLYKFDEHDVTFQRIWEREMKRSQAKAENNMLEILLSESNAKLKEIDASLDNMNDGTQLSTSPVAPGAGPRSMTGDNQEILVDHEGGNPDQVVQKDNHDSIFSRVGLGSRTHIRREPDDAYRDIRTSGEQREPLREQRNIVRSVELGASLKALEDANRRAESAIAKAEFLEQKLNRLEGTRVRRSIHTPPDTPSALSSPFSHPLPLASTAIQTMSPPSVQHEESVRSRSISSFRKKFFGRHKPSLGAVS